MLNAIAVSIRFILLILAGEKQVALENAALRQQLAVFKRNVPRPKLTKRDRLFWICLYMVWQDWKSALMFVQPETVTSWHRDRFRRYWWKLSQSKQPGRPRTGVEMRKLIQTMAKANPTWGAPRIHGELGKLGFRISERTVSRLMPRKPENTRKRGSPFFEIMSAKWSRSTSSPFRPYNCACCTFLSSFLMTVGVCCISMLPNTRLLHGRHSRSWSHFRTIPRLAIWYGIAMGSTDMISRHGLMDWVSDKYRYRPGVRGRLLCRTDNREHSSRMLKPRDRDQRVASASNSEKLLQVLPSVENASVVG